MDVNEYFDRTIQGGIRWERLARQRMEQGVYGLRIWNAQSF